MLPENGISFEVSEKMAMVLVSCFEMVGMSPPTHITSDRMALVVDRINKNRKELKKKFVFKASHEDGKMKEIQVNDEDDDDEEKTSGDFGYLSNEGLSSNQKTAIVCSKLGFMRSMLRMILQNEKYRVFVVNSYKDLLLVLKSNEFDMVVAEVNKLDELVPLAKTRLLMSDLNNLIVISSELKDMELRLGCKEIGVDVYIEKFADWQRRLMSKITSCGTKQLRSA